MGAKNQAEYDAALSELKAAVIAFELAKDRKEKA